jgi:hypothetical protein
MFIYLDYTASNGWLNDELKKPYQGSGNGPIEVLSQQLPGGTKTIKSQSGYPVSQLRFEPNTS